MPTYSDPQLIQILGKAARRINRRLCLFGTTSEVVIDGTGEFLNPIDDGALEDIVLLQAECMLSSREFTEGLRDGSIGIAVKDGEQNIDTKSLANARGSFFDSPHSPCAELEQAIKIEKINRVGAEGHNIW